MLARAGQQRLRVGIELLGGIREMGERDRGEHHALVARHQVVEEFPALLALLLHVVRDDHVEVHVRVLPPRPVGYVGLHAEQPLLHLPHRLVRGHGRHVDGERQRALKVGELGHETVVDI